MQQNQVLDVSPEPHQRTFDQSQEELLRDNNGSSMMRSGR